MKPYVELEIIVFEPLYGVAFVEAGRSLADQKIAHDLSTVSCLAQALTKFVKCPKFCVEQMTY